MESAFPIIITVVVNLGGLASGSLPSRGCILQGHLFTHLQWYGYIVQKTFRTSAARVQYQLSFPVNSFPKLLIYHDEQIRYLRQDMTCEQRESILPNDNHQVISLHPNETPGCSVQSDSDSRYVVCVGERQFASRGPKTWYFVVSRCKDVKLLDFWYFFNITGYYGDCEADPLAKTDAELVHQPRSLDQSTAAVVSLAIVSGLSFVATLIFVLLWWNLRRVLGSQKRRRTGGGVPLTSQSTMTQDIFFVNAPANPPQREIPAASSRASSENYYEVIPDQRLYETSTINNQLSMPGYPRTVQQRPPYPTSRPFENSVGSHFLPHQRVLPIFSPPLSRNGSLNTPGNFTQRPDSFFSRSNSSSGVLVEDYPPPPYPLDRNPGGTVPYFRRNLNYSFDQEQCLIPASSSFVDPSQIQSHLIGDRFETFA